jgi:AraC-like DNA-binding protein
MRGKETNNSGVATLRVGGALGILAVLRELGIDPMGVLRDAGIDPQIFDNPDNLIAYRTRGRLMACAVQRTGCPHFGLLVGQRMNLQSLGLVGLLALNAPDVRTALRGIATYLHLHARGAMLALEVDQSLAILTYDICEPDVPAANQIGFGAVAMMVNAMRAICRPAFEPVEARFACRPPADIMPFRRFFQVPLRFEAEHYALVFSSEWLQQPVQGADAELRRVLQLQIDSLEARYAPDFPETVRGVLRSALFTGHGRIEEIAALFSMHGRTLSRRLEECGVGFQELVDEVRFEIARQMLKETSLNVSRIAEALGYTSASAFARAFRRWSGVTPGVWRLAKGEGAQMIDRGNAGDPLARAL